MLLDEEKATKLVDSGLTELNVSIDAARPDTYRRSGAEESSTSSTRVSAGSFARGRGARQVPPHRCEFRHAEREPRGTRAFIEQASDLGVDFVNCITYATYDWGFDNKRTPASYAEELAAARQRMDELGLPCKSFPVEDLSWSDSNRAFDCSFFWGAT